MLAEVPPSTRFQIAKRSEIYGQADAYDRIRHMLRFRCDDVAHLVTAPTLVADYELEEFSAGQAQELYNLLRAPTTYVRFGAADGAQYHDAPMAPQVRNGVFFHWLDRTLRS